MRRPLSSLLFGFDEPIDRRTYAITGFTLAFIKLGIDAGGYLLALGRLPTLLEALSPLLSTRKSALAEGPPWLLTAILLVALPFLWVGISMTVRRAVDAGASPWLAMLFFVPIANYLVIAFLCVAPSKPSKGWVVLSPSPTQVAGWKSALQGILLGVGLTWLMVGASVLVLGAYGSVLFLATPFIIGTAASYLFNRGPTVRSIPASLGVAALAVTLAGSSLLLVALEGLICIAMALPIALVVGLLGAVMGRGIALRDGRISQLLLAFVALPFLSGADAALDATTLRAVRTEVEISATPSAVWPHVVGFAEIETPPPLLFRVGVAYPIRATIDRAGVGAIRRCEFSTGAFVEPITAWNPPTHLAFDVREQPPPMHEWSPYSKVHAPHLLTGLRSQRGEFRLEPLGPDRTRLVGTTWYALGLFPEGYWSLWSDMVIHSIHERVLTHIKTESEGSIP